MTVFLRGGPHDGKNHEAEYRSSMIVFPKAPEGPVDPQYYGLIQTELTAVRYIRTNEEHQGMTIFSYAD